MKFYNLTKRWLNMLSGKSVFHVEQGKGKCYSLKEVKGYYNDLTKKVSDKTILDSSGIPINTTVTGTEVYFPIAIFQYALGLYDLYLIEKKKEYLDKFLKITEWAKNKQLKNGMWECMGALNDKCNQTQSAMCQSEGASVFLRAYNETKKVEYIDHAKKAIDFMIKNVDENGTCYYPGKEKPIFQEYVSKYNVSVLNGWIFAIFGLYDFTLVNSEEKYKKILNNSVNEMAKSLKIYDRKFWSNYDQKGTIASPAYHDLHIKQLLLMYQMFGIEEFEIYAKKWEKYQRNNFFKILSMIIKLKQKLFKSKYYDIDTSIVK